MRLTWWGHSSVVVETQGVRLIADPVLRRRLGMLRHVFPHPTRAETDQLPDVDVVLVSHLHHDHCDLPTLRRLDARLVVAPAGSQRWLTRRGVRHVQEVEVGEHVTPADGVAVAVVPARHSGRREPWGPTASAVGHVVVGGGWSVWLAGDTGLFDAMGELAATAGVPGIDVAVVPVWGWGPTLGPGHLDPGDAADAVRRVGARHAVPVHWGSLHPAGMRRTMRHHLRTPGERFARAVAVGTPRGDSATQVHLLEIGETLVLGEP